MIKQIWIKLLTGGVIVLSVYGGIVIFLLLIYDTLIQTIIHPKAEAHKIVNVLKTAQNWIDGQK